MKKCQFCGKLGPVLSITQVVNGEVTELCLCEECARSRGILDPTSLSFNQKFSPEGLKSQIEALMRNVVDKASEDLDHAREMEKLSQKKCPVCEFSLADWHRTGRLGCPDCYISFKAELKGESLVSEESPAVAVAPSSKMQLKQLELQMAKAIEVEDYEKAAALRDQIAEIKKK